MAKVPLGNRTLGADPVYGDIPALNSGSINNKYNARQQGVFALHPLATPKYAFNKGERDAEYKESMARLFVALPPKSVPGYLASLPDDATRNLARVLIGAGQKAPTGFIDFFLQQASETFSERMQIDEVLSDNYVAFFFGENPPVFQYSGMLLNSQQDDQRVGFALAYQHILRGSKLARAGGIVRLRYDSVIVEGTINNASQVLNAENELAVPFSFSVLVKTYIIVQSSKFRKMSASDYVQLATPFIASNALGKNVARASDVRVRTTMVTPPSLSGTSAAGQEEQGPTANPEDGAPAQLMNNIALIEQPLPANSDIRGTITTPQTPPEGYAESTGVLV